MSATEAPEIVLIAYDAPPTIGGIQTHFAGLARGFVENGVRCLALAPRVPGCEEFDRSFVCPIIRVGDLRKGVYALAAARQLRYLAHKLPPPRMVIALNTLPAGLAYVLARVRQWAPLGITGYSTEFLPESGSLLRGVVLRRVVAAARLCFAVSSYTAENFRRMGVADRHIGIVYTGVDAKRLLGQPADPQRIRAALGIRQGQRMLLTVARLVPRKGQDTVIRALPRIAAEFPDVVYVIVGDGPMRGVLEQVAGDLGVQKRVIFAGQVPDDELPSYYAACDAFVMVPRHVPGDMPEGFGIVYLEAAIFGKPAVGSRCGGVPDAIVHGLTGVLVEPDNPAETANAIMRLPRRPEEAAAMGRAAKERALQEFTWKAVAGRYLDAMDRAGC